MKRHAIKVLKLDIARGNVIECGLPVGARIIGGHVTIDNPKIALRGQGGGIVPAITLYFDPDEQRMETRRLVVIASGKGGAAAAIEYDAALQPACVIVQPGSGIAFAVFDAAADATDDESRCAVCAWPLAERIEDGCTRGNCSHRPRPERLYAPGRAAREFEQLMKGRTP